MAPPLSPPHPTRPLGPLPSRGFTLIEFSLVAVAIAAVLIAILLQYLSKRSGNGTAGGLREQPASAWDWRVATYLLI